MTRELHVDDVVAGIPRPTVMLLRALRRRCPRCAAKGVLHHWFHLVERCPECGFRFKRDEAFFLGVFTVNLVLTLSALFFVLIWLVLREAADQGSSLVAPVALGAICAVVLPIVAYPISTLVWSALDLSSDPLELAEIADAADAVDAVDAVDGNPDDDSDSGSASDSPAA